MDQDLSPAKCFWAFVARAVAATTVLAVLFGITGKARAHDWYPFECCGGTHCGPAVMTTRAGATYFKGVDPDTVPAFVSTVTVTYSLSDVPGHKETVIVPEGFPRRESKDGRLHACIVAGKLRCLFMPPAM